MSELTINSYRFRSNSLLHEGFSLSLQNCSPRNIFLSMNYHIEINFLCFCLQFVSFYNVYLILEGAHAEVARQDAHGSAPALVVSVRGVHFFSLRRSLCLPDQTPGTSRRVQIVAVGVVVSVVSCR